MTELLLCPFCGSIAKIKELPRSWWQRKPKYVFVECGRCKAMSYPQKTKKEAITAWNRWAENVPKLYRNYEIERLEGELIVEQTRRKNAVNHSRELTMANLKLERELERINCELRSVKGERDALYAKMEIYKNPNRSIFEMFGVERLTDRHIKLETMYVELKKITGFWPEELLEMLKRGYELKAPNASSALSDLTQEE